MNLKLKKSLGQNFLIDRNVLEQIVNTVNIRGKEILEIGPGSGNLTKYILKKKPTKNKENTNATDVFVFIYVYSNHGQATLLRACVCARVVYAW